MPIFGSSENERVYLRTEAINAIIESKEETLEGVAADWASREGFSKEPSRSSIYNWRNNGFPWFSESGKKYRVFEFCAMLDADPLALFDYERNGFFSRFVKIRRALHFGLSQKNPYVPFLEMYSPNEDWPSDELAKQYWKRNWYAEEFDNVEHYKQDEDALIKIRFKDKTKGLPRALHIAYRRIKAREVDPLWRFYGTVVGFGRNCSLYTEGGYHALMARPEEDSLFFRTHFGHRMCDFRVASLHEFVIDEIVHPFSDKSIIGFEW